MKLQLALDTVSLIQAKEIIHNLADVIDIVEIGTPLVVREGLKAVAEIKIAYPHLAVLADLKLMDAGKYTANMGFAAGADIVTVLGVSENSTIQAVAEAAQQQEKAVMVDMIAVLDIASRVEQVEQFGVGYICVHTGVDTQHLESSPLDKLKTLKKACRTAKTAVAGGIKAKTLPDILSHQPDIIIVGGGITRQENCREAAVEIKNLITGSC
ncbi:MAG: orotidine 5'-phosphate decarboxylase [SAR324 cluster bacterium]|nr:orotidine 5'-phosphate decarboxylase [SAR324 cluster bacterium]